jgi:predicted PurR-regulated permease PerM
LGFGCAFTTPIHVPSMNSVLFDQDRGWFTRGRVLTLSLALATLLMLFACYRIVKPFVPAVAFAVALAIATQRPYQLLRQRLRSDTAAAVLAVVLLTLLIVGPATLLVTQLVQEAVDNLNALRGAQGLESWRSRLENQPYLGAAVRWVESRINLAQQADRIAQEVASRATGLLKGSANVITQLVIAAFVLFFLYRDRQQALDAVYHIVPLSPAEASRLFARVRDTILAVVNGSLTVAGVQAVLAGLMYWLLGVPAAVLWATATFFMALVPVFGTFVVWGPIAVYLALTGSGVKALVLVGWGIFAVGTIDNFLYPFLVGDRLRLHTVPTLFAILGGVGQFGVAGLILGPLVLAITIGLLDIWWWRTTQGRSAEEAVATQKEDETPPGAVLS